MSGFPLFLILFLLFAAGAYILYMKSYEIGYNDALEDMREYIENSKQEDE